MSWDIYAHDIPRDVRSIEDIPDTFVAGPIGNRLEMIAKIKKAVPFARFSDLAWGTIEAEGFSIEIDLGDDDRVDCMTLHVRGDNTAAVVVSDILTQLDLRAVDTGTGEIFDHEAASEGMDRWRTYRDRLMDAN